MTWLTKENVRDDVQSKLHEITTKIDNRRSESSEYYENQVISAIVGNSLAAGNALKKEWFYSSVGIDWGDGDRETWYVSRALVAATFATDNVIHWTHWIGRLCTQIREYMEEHGTFPDVLPYGPSQKEELRKVGPLVRYQFTDGRLIDFAYTDVSGTSVPSAEALEPELARPRITEPTPPSFGLKDIVELRDLAQDDQIRGPMAGIYILTGGPGVGKTSVALHRIPYLLLEQFSQLPTEIPGAPLDFFRTESIHVVVWKEHLVPYLKQCLSDLSFGNVGVHHVEDWVARALREYVRIGKGKGHYQIEPMDEPEEFRRIKLGFTEVSGGRWFGLTEDLLSSYLTGQENGEFHNPLASQMVDELRDQLAKLSVLFRATPSPPRFRDPTTEFVPTVAGIEAAIQVIRDELDRLAEEVSKTLRVLEKSNQSTYRESKRDYEKMQPLITRARDTVATLRERLIEQLTKDYPELLSGFYKSGVVSHALIQRFGQGEVEEFVGDACGRLNNRRLSRSDRYLLLWLVHILTRSGEGTKQAQPLRQYSHTVVDEAQYYHPLVLRLLVDLAKPPLRSITIVGDLEQKVTNEGGLVDWGDAGIKVERDKIFRLNTNYRWSKSVFQFLDIYRRLVGLRELQKPRRWASGDGLAPTVARCLNEDDQVSWLIDRVSALRRTDWSIAVAVPPSLGADWRDQVINELASCDIRSRWAVGEDVRECEEQIILTDYESIVGLEFDVVLLPGCERVLTPPTPSRDAIQAAWVALTRPRLYVGVSHVDPIAVFDADPFQAYRSAYIPEPL